MNATFTCKISTTKIVRFIFLLKQVMPQHFCFCYLLRPCSWGRQFFRWVPKLNRRAGGAGAEGASPSSGGEWWSRSSGSSLGAAVTAPAAALSPSHRVTLHCLWKRVCSAFWRALQMKNIIQGRASIMSLDFKGASGRVGFEGKVLLSVVSLWQWIIWASWVLCQRTHLISMNIEAFPFLLGLPLCLSCLMGIWLGWCWAREPLECQSLPLEPPQLDVFQ